MPTSKKLPKKKPTVKDVLADAQARYDAMSPAEKEMADAKGQRAERTLKKMRDEEKH